MKRLEPNRTRTIAKVKGNCAHHAAPVIKETIANWTSHRCSTLGAALAYYSVFSFGPLLVVSTAIAGFVFGADAVHGDIMKRADDLLGTTGALTLQTLVAGANRPHQGFLATIFGVGMLLFGAVGIVSQLKESLNTVWEVESAGGGPWLMARRYLISLVGVLSFGFLLLVSLAFTAALTAVGKFVAPYLPIPTLQITTSAISLIFATALFAMMFKWLPDTEVDWRDVWLGAALTAVLFEIGKVLIGFYVGTLALQSTYGAATSIVMLLIWIFYSSQIFLLGAEFTHVYARRFANARQSRFPAGAPPGEAQARR